MGSGIVYCRTREECERMATRLTEEGIPTYAYHAGLSNKVCFFLKFTMAAFFKLFHFLGFDLGIWNILI